MDDKQGKESIKVEGFWLGPTLKTTPLPLSLSTLITSLSATPLSRPHSLPISLFCMYQLLWQASGGACGCGADSRLSASLKLVIPLRQIGESYTWLQTCVPHLLRSPSFGVLGLLPMGGGKKGPKGIGPGP